MRKSKLILTIIAILMAALLLIACGEGEDEESSSSPDYPEPPVESNAETFVETDDIGGGDDNPSGGEKLDKTTGGGAVGLTYMTEVTIDITSGTASLYFANPSRSVDNISLKLYVTGFKVAETGILVPGTMISTLPLNDVGLRTMNDRGNYEGKFVVEFYNSESNEKSVLNTEIPITVKVR